MKSIRLLLAVLLLCGSAHASQTLIRTITSGDLPYTISTSGTITDTAVYRISGTAITSATNGIIVANNVQYVMIDGQGDTLKFGTNGTAQSNPVICGVNNDAGEGDRGIFIGAGVRHFVISDLKVWHDPPSNPVRTDPTYQTGAVGIRILPQGTNYSHHITLKNVKIKVVGTHSRPILNKGGIYNLYLENVTYIDSCYSYVRRDYWANQSMVNISAMNRAASMGVDFEYHIKMRYCTTLVAFWNNYHLEGDSSVIDAKHCDFFTDGKNALNGVTNCASMTTCTENFVVALRQGDPAIPDGVKIKFDSCRVRTGTANAGGRGFFISGVEGVSFDSDDASIAIVRCSILVAQGPDGSNPNCYAFKVREGWGNVRIHHNFIRVTGDIDAGTTYLGNQLIAFDLTSTAGSLSFPDDQQNLLIENNLCSLYLPASARTAQNFMTGTTDVGAHVIMAQECSKEFWDGIIIRNNHWVSNGSFYTFGWYNGPASGFTVVGDTCEFYGGTSPNDNDSWTARAGYHTNPSGQTPNSSDFNTLINIVPLDGVDPNHVFVDEPGEADSHTVKIQYVCSTSVLGGNGLPIRGATVTYRNAYNAIAATGLTDNYGILWDTITTYYLTNNYAGAVDSSAMNPFTITATLGAATANQVVSLGYALRQTTITLSSIDGRDPQIDTVQNYLIVGQQTLSNTATIGIPRFQIACFNARGWLTVFTPPGANFGGFVYEMHTTKNLDSSTVWINHAYGGASSSQDFDHMHLSVYNDTIYGGTDNADRHIMWRLNNDSLTRLQFAAWPQDAQNSLHNFAAWRLPGSDTVIAAGRFADEPKTQNVSYLISTDRGQTYPSTFTYFPEGNWAAVTGTNIRYGGGIFNNTVFFAYDSSNNGGTSKIVWWEWDRTNRVMVRLSNPITLSANSFHAFACNAVDTFRWVATFRNDVGSGTNRHDYLRIWYRGKNATDWTMTPEIDAGVLGGFTGAASPYVAITRIDSTGRLVVAYSYAGTNTNDSSQIRMTYWQAETGSWASPVKISRGMYAWKVSTASNTPLSHGDVAYFQIPYDTVISGTRYRNVDLVRARFSNAYTPPSVDPDPDPDPDPQPGNYEPGYVRGISASGVTIR